MFIYWYALPSVRAIRDISILLLSRQSSNVFIAQIPDVARLVILTSYALLPRPFISQGRATVSQFAKNSANIVLRLGYALPTAIIYPTWPSIVGGQRLRHIPVVSLQHPGHISGLAVNGFCRVHGVNAILPGRGWHKLSNATCASRRNSIRIKARFSPALGGKQVWVNPVTPARLFVQSPKLLWSAVQCAMRYCPFRRSRLLSQHGLVLGNTLQVCPYLHLFCV